MSTPAIPVSTVASAPAATSPAAAVPNAVPNAPVPVANPAGGNASPEVTPVPGAAGAGAAQPAEKAAPKNTDYPNNADGQVKFLSDLKKWEKEQKQKPEADPKSAAAQLGAQPGEAAKPAAAKTEGAPAEGTAPQPAAPAAESSTATTPQHLAELMEKTPAFKSFMEENPEIKGKLFSGFRKLAEYEPIAQIFPTVGDAQFAQEQSSNMLQLRTLSLRTVDSPEAVPQFLEAFDSQFARVDGEGKPVLENGKPVYDADRQMVLNGLVNRELDGRASSFGGEMQQLQQKLATGVYPNETAKLADQKRLENLEYAQLAFQVVGQVLSGEYFQEAPPQIPADASQEFRSWAESEQNRIKQEREALDAQRKGQSAEQRQQERAQFATNVRSDLGGLSFTMIAKKLEEAVQSGMYIPQFYLQERYIDPKTHQETNTPAIAARIFMQFENELKKPGSKTLLDITQHEMLPANEQTRQIRKDYYQRKAAEIIPGLVDKELARIQGLVKVDQERQGQKLAERSKVAQPEPATGGSGLPSAASEQQLRQQAEEEAKKLPQFAAASPSDKQAMILTKLHQMRKAGYRQ